jgi:uncharacterized protein YbjQ (UPF0145 family)
MPIWFTCECGHLLVVFDEHAGSRARCPRCGRERVAPAAHTPSPPGTRPVLLSSGDIARPHEVLGSVSGYAAYAEGARDVGAAGEAYRRALIGLREQAIRLGADAVLRLRIRVTIPAEDDPDAAPTYRVFAWGTAVRLRDGDPARSTVRITGAPGP